MGFAFCSVSYVLLPSIAKIKKTPQILINAFTLCYITSSEKEIPDLLFSQELLVPSLFVRHCKKLLYVQCSSLLEAKFDKSVIELGALTM